MIRRLHNAYVDWTTDDNTDAPLDAWIPGVHMSLELDRQSDFDLRYYDIHQPLPRSDQAETRPSIGYLLARACQQTLPLLRLPCPQLQYIESLTIHEDTIFVLRQKLGDRPSLATILEARPDHCLPWTQAVAITSLVTRALIAVEDRRVKIDELATNRLPLRPHNIYLCPRAGIILGCQPLYAPTSVFLEATLHEDILAKTPEQLGGQPHPPSDLLAGYEIGLLLDRLLRGQHVWHRETTYESICAIRGLSYSPPTHAPQAIERLLRTLCASQDSSLSLRQLQARLDDLLAEQQRDARTTVLELLQTESLVIEVISDDTLGELFAQDSCADGRALQRLLQRPSRANLRALSERLDRWPDPDALRAKILPHCQHHLQRWPASIVEQPPPHPQRAMRALGEKDWRYQQRFDLVTHRLALMHVPSPHSGEEQGPDAWLLEHDPSHDRASLRYLYLMPMPYNRDEYVHYTRHASTLDARALAAIEELLQQLDVWNLSPWEAPELADYVEFECLQILQRGRHRLITRNPKEGTLAPLRDLLDRLVRSSTHH